MPRPVLRARRRGLAVAAVLLGGALMILSPLPRMGAGAAPAGQASKAGTTTTLAAPRATAARQATQLSIAISNGRKRVKAGDSITYTVSVTNQGTAAVKRLRVVQSVPPGLTFRSADQDGTADRSGVHWDVDLKVAGKVTRRSTMTVTKTPSQLLRLATVACASMSIKAPPIVCAADSDVLPAGAAAQAAAPKPKHATVAAASSSSSKRPLVMLVALLVLAIAGTLLIRRRHDRVVSGGPAS
jgi:uncharacterized repeat protein (TIGR01451 family)